MSDETVKLIIEGPVARLILNRPEKRNAINVEIISQLHARLDELALNPEVRVVTLSGEGPIFSSGIDMAFIAGLGAVDENSRGMYLREMARKIQAVTNRMESLEKPVIAVIHRHCVGLALEIALGCDFRIVSRGTRLSLPEVLLGLIPDCGGTTRLTRLIGPARAKEVVMLGDPIDADEAKALGLVTAVADEDKLWEKAQALIDRLVSRPARVLGLAKRMVDISASIDRMTSLDVEPIVQTCAVTAPDFMEVMAKGFQALQKKK